MCLLFWVVLFRDPPPFVSESVLTEVIRIVLLFLGPILVAFWIGPQPMRSVKGRGFLSVAFLLLAFGRMWSMGAAASVESGIGELHDRFAEYEQAQSIVHRLFLLGAAAFLAGILRLVFVRGSKETE